MANGVAKESDNSWERFAETFSSIRSSIIYLMEAISFYYCLTMCVLTSESLGLKLLQKLNVFGGKRAR